MLDSVLYLSIPRVPLWPTLIVDFDKAAVRNNREFGLTGVLLFGSSWMLQYLEGDTVGLSERMHAIRTDDCHRFVWEAHWPQTSLNLPGIEMGYIDANRERGVPNVLRSNALGSWPREEAPMLLEAVLTTARAKYALS